MRDAPGPRAAPPRAAAATRRRTSPGEALAGLPRLAPGDALAGLPRVAPGEGPAVSPRIAPARGLAAPPRRRVPPWAALAAAAAVALAGCAAPKPDVPPGAAGGPGPAGLPSAEPGAAAAEPGAGVSGAAACPARAPAPSPLPGTRPEHESLAYWKARLPDETLLSADDLARLARALALPGPPDAANDVFTPEPVATTLDAVRTRFAWLRDHFASGEYVDAAGLRPPPTLFADAVPGAPADELRVALAPVPLRCGPTAAGLFTVPPNPAFDRNLCSTVPAQEALRVVARWPGGFLLVRARATVGFVAEDAPLSPPLSAEAAARLAAGPFVTTARAVTAVDAAAEVRLPAGLRLTSPAPGRVLFAAPDGLHEGAVAAAAPAAERAPGEPATGRAPAGAAADSAPPLLVPAARPLTRHAFLETAFAPLGTPYGWGGANGGRDCSQFVLEVLGAFGLNLPRNSAQQAQAGTYSVEIPPSTSERERLALLDAAAAHGQVLLHFPGHIMIYLGRDAAGVPMALHAFAEYLEPCPGGGETLREVSKVGVTTLELGRGTSRRAFVERLTRLTVFGPAPAELAALAVHRPPLAPEGECPDDKGAAAVLSVSPAAPVAGRPVRIIAATEREPGPALLELVAPSGERFTPPVRALGGPPYGRWTRLDAPTPGRWVARFGDAGRPLACRRFTVAERPPRRPADAQVYTPTRNWDASTENLYALFVEQLFRYPLADDLTWPNLQVLLAEPEHNLLLDHLGLGEDAALKLQPDCADLPYLLRAYYAWKMRLPFGFRACSKGRPRSPPHCGALSSSLLPRDGRAEVAAFQWFADRQVRATAHSGSGRTAPDDDDTDLYPVPLTREALRPGTVFADPYGHLLVIAQWMAQPPGGAGALIGAEAQPDGTIGRRRFWRGSFLFRPDVMAVGAGAGFKAWRPVRVEGGALTATPNRALSGGSAAAFAPFSRQQYQGDADAFYDAMEALLNPRPLDAVAQADALVAALEEAAVRRTISVQNGEDFQRDHPQVVAMPRGAAIFQTAGAWEDYSTPSRDFRLLIALDTVAGLPAAVARRPERFGLAPGDRAAVEAAGAEVARHLEARLAERRFDYLRSDGSKTTLTLADVARRASAFEVAYNPNDCPEVRWGAPEGSPERATCRRRAPDAQRARMEAYRVWFRTRSRPLQ